MPIRQLCLLCLLPLLLSACSVARLNESGLFGRFPENYEDPKNDFSLWMPANMHAREGIYGFVVQNQINACVNGRFRGVRYDRPDRDVYKQLDENTRLYAYYYYYYEDVPVGVDAPAFNLTPTDITVCYITVINMTVNKEGLITGCSYMRFRR